MSEARIEELEIRYAHLEKTLHELSDVVWRQQRELDLLRDVVKRMQDRLPAEHGLVDAARQDKPPHY